jgi:hypothetical protein
VFIRGRAIYDNFRAVQATANALHALKCSTILLKIDIPKAFDTGSWAFLLDLLSQSSSFGDWGGVPLWWDRAPGRWSYRRLQMLVLGGHPWCSGGGHIQLVVSSPSSNVEVTDVRSKFKLRLD